MQTWCMWAVSANTECHLTVHASACCQKVLPIHEAELRGGGVLLMALERPTRVLACVLFQLNMGLPCCSHFSPLMCESVGGAVWAVMSGLCRVI
jgi:hypothetical protein